MRFPDLLQIVPECDVAGPTSYFWYRVALDASPGIDETGGIKWKMLLSLLFSWFVVYLCICKGIKSSGKVSWNFIMLSSMSFFHLADYFAYRNLIL